jgi:predicted deacylase
MRAIERIRAELAAGSLELTAGTLYLIHGNPPATEQQERYTRGGVDLNRLFDYRFLTDLAPEHRVYEHERALALRPLLESADVLLDLHSTTAPSPAFAIASPLPESRAFADALGLPFVTEGWDAPGLLGDRVILAPLTRRGLPAVSVECGQHEQPESSDVAYQCIRRALGYLGLVACDAAPPGRATIRLLLRAAIKRPSSTFRFARPLASMQELAASELIGFDEDISIAARKKCYVIMPNDSVPVGEDMLYIAEAEDS